MTPLSSEDALGNVFVVLVRPLQPGNVGAAARAIANHGLGGLVLVAPPAFDPDRARWMAPGTTHVIDEARFFDSVSEAVASLHLVVGTTARARRWDWPVWSPGDLAGAVLSDEWCGSRVGILFGPEDIGLSNADLATCAALVQLPTTDHSSLNLAQAVTVTCSALLAATRRSSGATPSLPPAPVGLQEKAMRDALRLLEAADYLDSRSREQVEGTLFRLLHKARPSPREITALLGMMEAIQWKLDHPGR